MSPVFQELYKFQVNFYTASASKDHLHIFTAILALSYGGNVLVYKSCHSDSLNMNAISFQS